MSGHIEVLTTQSSDRPVESIEKLMCPGAAADALGTPVFVMRRAAKAGQFPTYRLGNRRRRVRLSEVTAAIDRLASTPAPF